MKTGEKKFKFAVFLGAMLFCFSYIAVFAADQGVNIPKDEDLEDALSFLNEEKTPQENPVPKAEAVAETFDEAPAALKEASAAIPEKVKVEEKVPAEASIEETAEKIFEAPKELSFDKVEAPKQSIVTKPHSNSGNYDVSDHLPEAATVLFNPQRTPETMGTWRDGAFTFQGYQKQGDIRTKTFVVQGDEVNAVTMKLVTGRIHVITFQGIPPGARLSIRYNLAETTSSKVPIFAYLRVLVGHHELKRIQVSSKDPWKSQSFDLGIVSFLDRNIKLTFEVAPERIQGLTFSFAAAISKN